MKSFIFFALTGILFITAAFQTSFAVPGQGLSPDDFPNYVVIGAFASQDNAIRFVEQANAMNYHAQFDINPNRNLYYVFVMTTENRVAAVKEAMRLRSESPYKDAWVYQGVIGKVEVLADNSPSTDTDPVTDQTIAVASLDNIPVATDTAALTEMKEATSPEVSLTADNLEEKSFIFQLVRNIDHNTVEGDVDVIDVDKAWKMASFKANMPVHVSPPSGKSGKVSFTSQVFGYRKVQQDFNFKDPSSNPSITIDKDGNIVVPFDLVRLQRGDIAVMYNVFYYKDAAIMRPESHYEVNNLLEMLKENPEYKITIHGHTNGNAHGKIITMGKSKDFFSLTGSKTGYGSAKRLSAERAKVIREFLVSKGIDEDRMKIKAWGGKRPIYGKNSARAQENVRVEIEIL